MALNISGSQGPKTDEYGLVETPSGAPALVVDYGDTGDMPLLTTVKKYSKRVMYVLLMIPAILLVGYDLVIVGTLASMPYFDFIYGEFYTDPSSSYGVAVFVPALWLGLWNGLGSLGNMCGALFAGWMHDRFGRRVSIGFGAIISALGIGIISASTFALTIQGKRGTFLAGKIIGGFAIGQVAATTQTYLSEITPHSLRGPVFAFWPAIILVGQLIGARILFNEIYVLADSGYKTCMLSMFAFSGAIFIVSFIMPESPTWLTRIGELDAARRSQKRLELAESNSGCLVDELVMVIEQEKHESLASDRVSLVQCFRGVDARRTWIVILSNTMTNMFGICFLSTATYFYELLGVEAGLAIKLLEAGIGIGIAANFISTWTTTKFQRRPLMIGTFLIIALLWLGFGISGCFTLNNATRYWSVASMMGVIFVAGLGVWPTSVAVSSEASSLRLRGQTQAIGWIWQNLISGVLSIVLPYIYTPNQGNSKGKIGFLFFGTSVIGAVLAWLYVPEMKGRTASEIDAMFHANVHARKFGQWTPELLCQIKDKVSGEVMHIEDLNS